jgi:hypothetical protein
VDALTALVELGVGIGCVTLGVTFARARPVPVVRVLGALLAVAGLVAAAHAVRALL